jgi:hypothetical protein
VIKVQHLFYYYFCTARVHHVKLVHNSIKSTKNMVNQMFLPFLIKTSRIKYFYLMRMICKKIFHDEQSFCSKYICNAMSIHCHPSIQNIDRNVSIKHDIMHFDVVLLILFCFNLKASKYLV